MTYDKLVKGVPGPNNRVGFGRGGPSSVAGSSEGGNRSRSSSPRASASSKSRGGGYDPAASIAAAQEEKRVARLVERQVCLREGTPPHTRAALASLKEVIDTAATEKKYFLVFHHISKRTTDKLLRWRVHGCLVVHGCVAWHAFCSVPCVVGARASLMLAMNALPVGVGAAGGPVAARGGAAAHTGVHGEAARPPRAGAQHSRGASLISLVVVMCLRVLLRPPPSFSSSYVCYFALPLPPD